MRSQDKIILGVVAIVVVVSWFVKRKKQSSESVSMYSGEYKDLKPFTRTIPMQVDRTKDIGQLTV